MSQGVRILEIIKRTTTRQYGEIGNEKKTLKKTCYDIASYYKIWFRMC